MIDLANQVAIIIVIVIAGQSFQRRGIIVA
jgi:hypothetical protein